MKKILYVIAGLAALYLILCLFGPAKSVAERSVEITVSPDVLKTKITDLKFFQERWSPWTEKDPKMKVTYSGANGQEGSSMSWISNHEKVGKGSMTYRYTHGDTVMQSLHFDDHGDSRVYHIVTEKGEGSHVRWIMEKDNSFFSRGIMLFVNMDKMVGADFEKGLQKLKKAIEETGFSVMAGDYRITETAWEAKTFYGFRKSTGFDKLAAFMGASYAKIGTAMRKAKATPVGAPKAIYFAFDEKTMTSDAAAVMEFAPGTIIKGLRKFETPASKVLHIAYYGPYDKSADAHYAMDAYIKTNNLSQVSVIEEYVTDPMTEKDSTKWLTNIYYVVK